MNNETHITSELDKNLDKHFLDALENFRKILRKFAGHRKESIPSAVKKNELDGIIVKFIKERK